MARRVSSHRIRLHRQYTYEEAARDLGVSVGTVRGWRGAGLEVFDDQTPHLIVGRTLKTFLDQRRKPARRLAPDQFLCMSCGTPKRAFGGMADYTPKTPTRGILMTLCETCEGPCTKFTSLAGLDRLDGSLSVVVRNGDDA